MDFINRAPWAATNQTAVILTADHGGGVPLNYHFYADEPLDFTLPLIVWGPGFPAGADLSSLYLNRADPGTNFVGYSAVEQPMRNGDSGNIAMSCLGLPVIPGSTLTPLTASSGTGSVKAQRQGDQILITWSRQYVNSVLEMTDAISNTPIWTPITTGIGTNINTLQYSIPLGTGYRFFHLRSNVQ